MKPLKCKWLVLLLPAALILAAWTASADVIYSIDVDENRLLPDRTGQTVQIWVTGAEQVSGLNFCVQIGDGGPELVDYGLPPGIDGPSISAIDLQTDTIFGIENSTQIAGDSIPQVAFCSVFTNSGSVVASGLLATLTIDTTGFRSGAWDLVLSGVLGQSTDFAPDAISIINGTIYLPIYGDCNFDNEVNETDLATLTDNWLQEGVGWGQGDFNGDGIVNGADATYLAANWQMTFDPPVMAVPEPATLVAFCIGIMVSFFIITRSRWRL